MYYDKAVETSPQRTRAQDGPSLAIAASWLIGAIQERLYTDLRDGGYADLTHLHGAVLAYLDPQGTRATELARRARRHKQVIGRVVDELEALGYVVREPDPSDRRAKLVVPTERGLAAMACSDRSVREIEQEVSARLGASAYRAFMGALRETVAALRNCP